MKQIKIGSFISQRIIGMTLKSLNQQHFLEVKHKYVETSQVHSQNIFLHISNFRPSHPLCHSLKIINSVGVEH